VPVSDRDRKILWGKAGNRCSKCRRVLVQPGEADGSTEHAVVGEECHIISPKLDGPRGRFETVGDLDGYANLILLCPSDHTLIDQLSDEWPPSRLHGMKREHEKWVNDRLSAPKAIPKLSLQRNDPEALLEITTSSALVAVVMGAMASSMDHGDATDDDDVEVVAGFLQTVFDYGEMWSDYEPGERIRAQHRLGRALADLRQQGWRLFGARTKGTLRGDDGTAEPWDTAYLRVVRADSDEIVKVPSAQSAPAHDVRAEAPDLEVRPLLGRDPMYDLATRKPTGRTGDFVWLNVKNRAHRSSGDGANVWAVINFPKFEMSPARWRDSPDPYLVADVGEISDRKTVRAGQTRQLDVAYRVEGERTGHGLNTEAMQPQYGWHRPGWELEPGEHVVNIRLAADNAPTTYYRLVLYLPEAGQFEIRGFEQLGLSTE
jgi:hypothetical protein